MAFDWGNLISVAVDTGTSLYDMYNKRQVAGDLQGAAVSPAVDPFGADQREYYQGKLRDLYTNPASVQNTPGYQFALGEMERGVSRDAAKAGHYRGSNLDHTLMERRAGLASQTYNTEADRLSKLAGSQFAPDGGSFADLYGSGAGIQGTTGAQVKDATKGPGGLGDWAGILSNFSDALGGDSSGGGLGDITGSLGIDFSSIGDALGIDLGGMGDMFEGLGLGGLDYMGAGQKAIGGDFKGAATDLATDYITGEGGDFLKDKGIGLLNDWFGGGGDAANSTDAITGMMDNEFQLGQAGQYGSLSGASAMGAGLGGALGGAGLTKLLGTEGNAATATTALGGVAGTAIGAGLGGMIAGTGFGAGAGAVGGAAAGGMAAGPLIPLAMAMMAYGSYSEDQAGSKARKDAAGQLDSGLTLQADGGSNWDSPYGNFYINKAAQDMWYSGDIDRGMGLYDQNDHNKYVGNFNWDTGRYEDRDYLLSQGGPGYSMEGLTGEQRAAQSTALTNYWDNVSVKAEMPYKRSGFGINGGDGGSGLDENYWLDAKTGQVADQGVLDAFNQEQARARNNNGDGGDGGVSGGLNWGGNATLAQYNQHQDAAKNQYFNDH